MTETKNNAKLIKRIAKKVGKNNLLEFFSVSDDLRLIEPLNYFETHY